MKCLAQGHLDTQLGGAGDQASNHPLTSPPALPPELSRTLDGCPTGFRLFFMGG